MIHQEPHPDPSTSSNQQIPDRLHRRVHMGNLRFLISESIERGDDPRVVIEKVVTAAKLCRLTSREVEAVFELTGLKSYAERYQPPDGALPEFPTGPLSMLPS